MLESHLLLPSPATPSTSRPRLSSPDPGAAKKGSATDALHERGAFDPPSGIQETIIAAPALPPQSPSPSSDTNVASTGPSRRSLGAEPIGDQPPHPSHGRYDIV